MPWQSQKNISCARRHEVDHVCSFRNTSAFFFSFSGIFLPPLPDYAEIYGGMPHAYLTRRRSMAAWNIRPLMSSVPLSINPKESLRRARVLMRAANVDELFVLDGGKLVGTLSESDIWKHCPTSTLVLDD